jgi:hypothetical protein
MPAPGSLASQDAARLSREATVSPKAAEAVLSDLGARIGDMKAALAAKRAKWAVDASAALGSALPLLSRLPTSCDRADLPKLEVKEAPGGYIVVVSIWTQDRDGWNYDWVSASDTLHASREAALVEIETIRETKR